MIFVDVDVVERFVKQRAPGDGVLSAATLLDHQADPDADANGSRSDGMAAGAASTDAPNLSAALIPSTAPGDVFA